MKRFSKFQLKSKANDDDDGIGNEVLMSDMWRIVHYN